MTTHGIPGRRGEIECIEPGRFSIRLYRPSMAHGEVILSEHRIARSYAQAARIVQTWILIGDVGGL